MKKYGKFLSMILSIVLIALVVITPTNVVAADSKESIQSAWTSNNNYVYPITPSDAAWKDLSYSEQLEVCNMPTDILTKCSTSELLELVLTYPFLCDILAFNNTELAIKHLINTSNICKEFFSRDNITDLLIQKYDKLHVDYEELLNPSNKTAMMDSRYMAELFLQTYFAHMIHSLTDVQVQKVVK